MIELGIDRVLKEKSLHESLKNKKISLVAHPASVTVNLEHSLNALMKANINVVSAFGPQHGLRGEKQDNMIESDDYVDPELKIPVFSLYGKTRRPTAEMMSTFDICLFDLQDVGTRIYTFLTTLRYMMEACLEHKKELWVLDRPNPAGRPIEGMCLLKNWESFVGAAPIPMRHGLTLGECALWMKENLGISCNLKIIEMKNYHPDQGPYFGWPIELSWVNPSPNIANVHTSKSFPGTVLVEGTHLSEGRGTTRALELVGAPNLNIFKVLARMESLKPEWMKGCIVRPCYFEPTFQKHQKTLCQGFQIHVDHPQYNHKLFKPYRLMALFFKALRLEDPGYEIWRDFPYEYEFNRLAIDLLNGGPALREWVDDKNSSCEDFNSINFTDEKNWEKNRKEILLYK